MNRFLLPGLLLVACQRDPETPPPVEQSPCAAAGLHEVALDTEGPFGLGRGSKAEPFTVPTLDGDWSLADHWTGCDVYGFIPEDDASSAEFAATIWDDDHKQLLKLSPPNTHWFFFTTESDATARVTALRDTFDKVLSKLDADEAAAWEGRLHFINKPINKVRNVVGDQWTRTSYGFVVDRDQRLRDIGSLGDPARFDNNIGWFGPNMSFAANEVVYANFVAERQARLDAEDVTVVRMIDQQNTGGTTVDVDMPANLADFDHLELDVTQACEGGDREFGTCPAWDYLAYLHQCGVPTVEPEPNGACQPRVAGQDARDEQLGACTLAGVATGVPCAGVDACGPGETCEGYLPAQAAIIAVDAETRQCTCTAPGGDEVELLRTCNDDGLAFSACPCPCVEVGRWITTYHREGRWVWDATQALATLKPGGKQRLRYSGGNTYLTTVDLRFSSKDKGWGAPSERVPLFVGGGFNAAYNDGREPVTVDIPADAKHVELVAVITGHGFGQDQANCAEFCNHTHHFSVGEQEWVVDHPFVGDDYGCMAQVADGTVPNQFGTWFFGRGGWCPGREAAPHVFDLDEAVTPGQPLTITYEGKLDGEAYVPVPANNGGFGARIDMDSFLVIWR